MSRYGDDFGDKQKNLFRGFGWKGRKRDGLGATAATARDTVKDVASAGASSASQVAATIAAANLALRSAASASAAHLAAAKAASASAAASSTRAASTTFHDYDDDHSGWGRWLPRLFGPRTEAWIGALALLFTLGVGGLIIKDALNARFKDKTGVQRIFAKRWNERTLAFPIEGTGAAGRRALFDVVVLTKNYGWVL